MLRCLAAVLAGVALSLGGGLLWGLLFHTNLRVAPALPWSAIAMLSVMGLSYLLLSRANLPRRLIPAPELGVLPWMAALAIALCLVSAVIVGLRFAHLPADAFASSIDWHALPPSMQVARVVMASSVAAFFEEWGFRGLIQGSLEQRHGPAPAIAVTGVLFYLMHVGHGWTQGDVATVLAVAIPFFIGSALWGVLAMVTRSLAPSMLAHALADMTLLPIEWTGRHRLDPVETVGVDAHFVAWTLLAVSAGGACILLLRQLASRARQSKR